MSRTPLPIAAIPRSVRHGLTLVLSDLDDTLTHAGRLHQGCFHALERLHTAGIPAAVVTGRPAGWCDHLARMWPVCGVVGENGALWMRYDPAARRMVRSPPRFESLEEVRRRLTDLGRIILARVPAAQIAADQPFRLYDLAIDIGEDVPRLSDPEVSLICRIAAEAGATAQVSSIHVNCWFGTYTKLDGVLSLIRHLLEARVLAAPAGGSDPLETAAYIGDSPNDEPLFAAVGTSVGVANVARYLPGMAHPPRFITRSPGAVGFVELTDALLLGGRTDR